MSFLNCRWASLLINASSFLAHRLSSLFSWVLCLHFFFHALVHFALSSLHHWVNHGLTLVFPLFVLLLGTNFSASLHFLATCSIISFVVYPSSSLSHLKLGFSSPSHADLLFNVNFTRYSELRTRAEGPFICSILYVGTTQDEYKFQFCLFILSSLFVCIPNMLVDKVSVTTSNILALDNSDSSMLFKVLPVSLLMVRVSYDQ